MAKNLDKLKENAKLAKGYADKFGSMYDSEKRRENYLKERDELKASPEYIRNATIRKMLQDVAGAESASCETMLNAVKKLSSEIYEFITTELNYSKKGVKPELREVEEIVNYLLPALKKLKLISENESVRSKSNERVYSEYDRLFNKLIELDAKFLLFAPNKSLERSNFNAKFNMLPEYMKKDVLERKLDTTEDADYISKYMTCEFEPNERTKKVEKMIEDIEISCEKSKQILVDATSSLSNSLYEFFVVDLGLGKGERVSQANIEKTIQYCLEQIKRLKKLTLNPQICELIKEDEYARLFTKLMQEEIRFAMYAPKESLKRMDIDFKQLSEDEKDIIFNKLLKYGLMDDFKYFDNYRHVFAAQIAKFAANLNVNK